MPRKITSGTVGGQVLGNLSTQANTFQSVKANTNIVLLQTVQVLHNLPKTYIPV